MKYKIKNLINNPVFEKSIFILIMSNLIIFILDTMSGFHNQFSELVRRFEIFSISIFTVEYILRLLTLERPKDIFKPMMLIDFFAVFPYYLTCCNINTIFLRIFRLSRIIRILKIARYTEAVENIKKAFLSKKEELVITFSIFAVSILLSAIFMYFAEYNAQPQVFSSIPKCIYFSIITFTSVGYGDITPITSLGKIVCSITAILGIGIHGLFIGVIGAAIMAAFKENKE